MGLEQGSSNSMKKRPTHAGRNLAISMAVSVFLHLAMLPGLHFMADRSPSSKQKQKPADSAVMLVDGQKVLRKLKRQKVRASKHTASPRPIVKPKPKKIKVRPPEKPKRQVVEIPPPKNEAVPEHARFSSEYNSSVEREQVSARKEAPSPEMKKADRLALSTGRDHNGSLDGKRKARQRPIPMQPKRVTSESQDRKAQEQQAKKNLPKTAPQQQRTSERPKLHQGQGPFAPAQNRSQRAAQRRPQDSPTRAARPPSHWRSLLPNLGPRDLARRDGSIDRVEDVDEGDSTFLNTREYRHAWFFNRIKRSVQQRWRAVDAHRRYDPYGRVYGVRDRVTVVEVTLSEEGGLEDIFVTKDSGVAFLDEAAVTAFRAAQPFPNPPEGLRDADGLIRFQFGFHLAINGRGFRMFRYR